MLGIGGVDAIAEGGQVRHSRPTWRAAIFIVVDAVSEIEVHDQNAGAVCVRSLASSRIDRQPIVRWCCDVINEPVHRARLDGAFNRSLPNVVFDHEKQGDWPRRYVLFYPVVSGICVNFVLGVQGFGYKEQQQPKDRWRTPEPM